MTKFKSLKSSSIIILSILCLIAISAIPYTLFTAPSPANSVNIAPNNSVILNFSIVESDLSSVIYNWNGTNYTMYDGDLVGMWSLNEASGNAIDNSKYSNNGSVTGATQGASGKYGTAYSFDGAADYVNFGDTTFLDGQNFTLSMWVKPSTDSGNVFISKWDNSNENGFALYNPSGADTTRLIYGAGVGQNTVADATSVVLDDGNWHHIVGTLDSSGGRVYVDGVLRKFQGISYVIPDNGQSLQIGYDSELYSHTGSIDEVRIWNRSLSASEIYVNYVSNLQKFNSTTWGFYINQSQNTTDGLGNSSYTYQLMASDTSNAWNISDERTLSINYFPQVNFTSPTPANASTQNYNSVYINVTSSDVDNNISTFIDFDNSLIGWWRMDDLNASGDPTDYTGRNNGSAVGGAVQTASGKMGKAFAFNGTNYLEIGDKLGTNITGNITMSAWIKPLTYVAGETSNAIIGKTESLNGIGYSMVIYPTTSFTYVYSTNALTFSNSKVIYGQWQFVVMTYNGTKASLYINGALNSTGDADYPSVVKRSLQIGARGDANYKFNGSIDDVMIFNRSLSANEILNLYANTSLKYLGQNFTGLNDGNHTFKAYAQDLAGNVNATETTKITLAVPPTAIITAPTNNSYLNSASQNFSANLSDNTNLLNATLNIYNTTGLYNQTTASVSGTSSAIGIIVSVIDGIYNWFWNIFDFAGNSYTSDNQSVTIDTTLPIPNFVAPTPANNSGRNGFLQVNVSITELNLANISYYWNNTQTNITDLNKLDTGLVLMMNFNNESEFKENDTHVYDFSGSENNGTVNGANWTASGKYGGAYEFDGVNDYVSASSFNYTFNNATLSFWAKRNFIASGYKSMFQLSSADYVNSIAVYENGNIIFGDFNGGTFGQWSEVVTDYNWHYFSFNMPSINGTRIPVTLYYDGVSQSISNCDINPNFSKIIIGKAGDNYFNGSIDDVMIYNRSLSASEIQQLYNSKFRKYPNTGKLYLENYNWTNDTNKNYTWALSKNNATNWNLLINQSGVVAGKQYLSWISATDLAGNINLTETRTFLGNSNPTVRSLTQTPTSVLTLDPDILINITINATDADSNFDSAILQWKNKSADWQTATNITMSALTAISDTTILNASFTPTFEQNISYRIWLNDTEGGTSYNDTINISVFWDCSWNSTTSLGAAAGWSNNVNLGNITITNLGDSQFSSGCSLDYRATYNLEEGRVYYDGEYVKSLQFATIPANSSQNFEINATFGTTAKVEDLNLTVQEFRGRSNLSEINVSATLVTNQNGPYLFEEITSTLSSVSLQSGNTFLLSGYIRNLMGSLATINDDLTAYNVTFNWTLPAGLTNNSGSLKLFFSNISNNSLNYNNVNISFSNLATMSSGIQTFYLYAQGLNITNNKIVYSGGSTLLTDSTTITFECYSGSDGIIVTSCGSLDGDYVAPTTTVTQTATTSGTGGGGGGAGNVIQKLSSSSELQLVRGSQNEVEVKFSNRYSNLTLTNLKFTLTGDIAKYTEVYPKSLSELGPNQEIDLKLKITSPAYLKLGKQKVTITIEGKKGTEPYFENKVITLEVHDISVNDSEKLLEQSEDLIKQLEELNLSSEILTNLLKDSQEQMKEFNLEKISENYKIIEKQVSFAVDSYAILSDLDSLLKVAEQKGIDTSSTLRLAKLAKLSLERLDFEEAYKRAKDAQMAYAFEVKGEIGKLTYYLKVYPTEISVAALFLAIFSFGTYRITKLQIIKSRIKKLKEEEAILIQLIKVVQRDCFEHKKMSMEEYQQAVDQYQRKLSHVIERLIELENQRVYALKFTRPSIKLSVEKQKVLDSIKQLQRDYLDKGEIESRVYQIKLKSYTKRITEIDQHLAELESKKAFKEYSTLDKLKAFFKK